MDKIMVSVIMPVYNSEEYLETAIKWKKWNFC